jgi:hypothetical protein
LKTSPTSYTDKMFIEPEKPGDPYG